MPPLPHLNDSSKGNYTDYYDTDSREIIARDLRADIEQGSYTFGQSAPRPQLNELRNIFTSKDPRMV